MNYHNVIVVYRDPGNTFLYAIKGLDHISVLEADLVIVARTRLYQNTGLKTQMFVVEKDRFGMLQTLTRTEIQVMINQAEKLIELV